MPRRRAVIPAGHDRSRGGSPGCPDVHPVIRGSLYLLVFSLPFEMPNLGMPCELAALTGTIFLLTTLIQPRTCYQRPPGAFWWFVVYLNVYVFVTLVCGVESKGETLKAFLMIVQAMLLFWTWWGLMRDDRLATGVLLTFIAACALLAAVHLSRAAATVTETGSNERLSAFGQNPNKLGRTVALGLVALLGLAYGSDRNVLRPRFLAWPLTVLLVASVVDSGSRGSLLALAAGLFTFVFRKGPAWLKFRNGVVGLLAIGVCVGLASQSESTWARIGRTVEEGSLAKREVLFPEAWGMFLDSPLVGWGPVRNMDELGKRVGEPDHPRRDTHNLSLELLTATGMLGTIPFLVGTGLCGWAAWKARRGSLGPVPFAMVAAILVASLGANVLYTKLHWLVMAIALAGAAQFFPAGSGRTARRHRPAGQAASPGPRPARARLTTARVRGSCAW